MSAAPQLRYVVMGDGTQRAAAPAGALVLASAPGAGAGAGAGPSFWTAEDPWCLPKRAAARAAVAACGYQPDPFWPSDGASAPPPSPRALAHHRERPPSAASRPLPAEEGDARAAGETRARASSERQAAAAAAAEEAEKPSELPPASRHSRRHRTHSRSDSARDHAHAHPHTHAHATHAKRCAQAAECAQQDPSRGAEPARPRRPRSAGAEAHGQHARASPRGLGLCGRVRYRREDTYIVAVPSNPALAVGPCDARGDADDGRGGGGGSCDGSPGRGGGGGAGGDSPGDLALRLAHGQCCSRRSTERGGERTRV